MDLPLSNGTKTISVLQHDDCEVMHKNFINLKQTKINKNTHFIAPPSPQRHAKTEPYKTWLFPTFKGLRP